MRMDILPLHQRELLLPDGAVQIIVDMAERPKKLYADAHGDDARDFRRASVGGMQTRPIVIEAQPGASPFVIRFTAVGARAGLGPVVEELCGRVELLSDVAGAAPRCATACWRRRRRRASSPRPGGRLKR